MLACALGQIGRCLTKAPLPGKPGVFGIRPPELRNGGRLQFRRDAMLTQFLLDPAQTVSGGTAAHQTFNEPVGAQVPDSLEVVEQVFHRLCIGGVRAQLAAEFVAAVLAAGQMRQRTGPQRQRFAADQAASSDPAAPRWFTP